MKLKMMVSGLAVAGLATHALAQTPTEAPQRIEVTGSSIKRIASEGALPVQVIRGEDITRSGITSAEQLLASIGANGNGIDNLTTNQGGDFLNSLASKPHNNGAAAANLRGLGSQYTLVLLNGRRLSTHGLNGQSVDLNSIPLAAVDRVEVLKDGASAIYGADAIGGVINFILKRDYSGLQATAFLDKTQHGGGDIYRGSVLFGAGDLQSQGFNFVASLTFDKNKRLRGNQRDFHDGIQPEKGLGPDTTGTPYANIGTGGGTALAGSFTLPGVTGSQNRVSLLGLQGKCDTVTDMYAYPTEVTGFDNAQKACAYDYGRQWSLIQPVDRTSLVARASFQLSPDHTATIEAVASKTKSSLEYTAIQLTTAAYQYPATGPYYQNLAVLAPTFFKPTNTDANDKRVFFDATKPLRIRWRCDICGPRQQDTTTDASRVLAGLEGVVQNWDYKLGLSAAQSEANTKYGDGIMLVAPLSAALLSGVVNPFLAPGQSQTPQAIEAINAAKAKGLSLYGGKASVTQIDLLASRSDLLQLPAGPMGLAVGFDSRKETYRFDNGTPGQAQVTGVGSPPSLSQANRTINAVFGELAIPIVKNLDLQVAARFDKYSDFGSTTNPKVALRYQPLGELLFRSSYSQGFHAPDFDPLYGGTSVSQFNSDINDPVLCPGGKPTDTARTGCGIRPEIDTSSNPNLKPEKSKQVSFGIVVSPVSWMSASLDFWRIDLTDRIAALSGQALIANYQQFSQYVIRDPVTKEILKVEAPFQNQAGDQTQGVDINVNLNFKTDLGDVRASLDGTYVDKYRTRFSKSDPWVERVGQFGDTTYGFDLHVRWKHTLSGTWSSGPISATLSQNFTAGYLDEVDGYGSGVILQDKGFQKRVKSYTTYNASVSWTGIKDLTLTAGIKNLLDEKPPFSLHNVDNVAGAGWDARVGDARGRAFTLRATYKFF
jgi:iron complex outermembrane recepter protein